MLRSSRIRTWRWRGQDPGLGAGKAVPDGVSNVQPPRGGIEAIQGCVRWLRCSRGPGMDAFAIPLHNQQDTLSQGGELELPWITTRQYPESTCHGKGDMNMDSIFDLVSSGQRWLPMSNQDRGTAHSKNQIPACPFVAMSKAVAGHCGQNSGNSESCEGQAQIEADSSGEDASSQGDPRYSSVIKVALLPAGS
ncbi:hypothetical protein S7711_10757 [Stachybotrys chartarum IBT 7711]|uniref:Uncharacterized protein n=1 Tax=Stachybotrys chartarum (strain CBS 109288 / IBT 7711) TaxID=1280523 RepID=A0A084AWU0_STACB|nr:hypothetical protein S7711_10757 [Stachybotrys chartarum IBT 7711]KFA49475.1 hypothetical protein S40293_10995 [Stachybotrys chartarum IBT 40293]